MTMKTVNVKQAALAKARQRRLALDADRDARDRRVEAAVAEVLVLLERRSEIERELVDTNTTIGDALRRVLAEDVALDGAAQLVDLGPAAVRRLVRSSARRRGSNEPDLRRVTPA
jgi:hypothetical protein